MPRDQEQWFRSDAATRQRRIKQLLNLDVALDETRGKVTVDDLEAKIAELFGDDAPGISYKRELKAALTRGQRPKRENAFFIGQALLALGRGCWSGLATLLIAGWLDDFVGTFRNYVLDSDLTRAECDELRAFVRAMPQLFGLIDFEVASSDDQLEFYCDEPYYVNERKYREADRRTRLWGRWRKYRLDEETLTSAWKTWRSESPDRRGWMEARAKFLAQSAVSERLREDAAIGFVDEILRVARQWP